MPDQPQSLPEEQDKKDPDPTYSLFSTHHSVGSPPLTSELGNLEGIQSLLLGVFVTKIKTSPLLSK